MRYITTIGEKEYTIDINDNKTIVVDGEIFELDSQGLANTAMNSIILNGHSFDVDISEHDDLYQVMLKGLMYDVKVEDQRTRRLAGMKRSMTEAVGEVLIKAPMPGVIVELPVEVGQSVSKGDVVIILESMKMQNEFKSPKDGAIKSIRVKVGDKIDQNTVMLSVD